MNRLHAACTGCYEHLPISPGQLFGLALIGVFTIALFAVALVALSRFNR